MTHGMRISFKTSHDVATHALRDWSIKLRNLAEIPKMMLHSLGEIPATLLTFGCLIIRWRAQLKASDLEKYLLLLAICFVVLANRVVHEYMLLFMPFMLVYCAETLTRLGFGQKEGTFYNLIWKHKWLSFLAILHVVAGFVYYGKFVTKNLTTEPLYQRNTQLLAILGTNPQKIIAPQSFIFNQIENMHIVGLVYYYHYNTFHQVTLTPQVFFQDAHQKKVDAIIFEKNPITTEYEPPDDLLEIVDHYQLIYRDDRYRIYQSVE